MKFDLEIFTCSNHLCKFSTFEKRGNSYIEIIAVSKYNSIPEFDRFEMSEEEFKSYATGRIMQFLRENSVSNVSYVNSFPENKSAYIEFMDDYLYVALKDEEILSGTGDLETLVNALITEEDLAIEIPEEYRE